MQVFLLAKKMLRLSAPADTKIGSGSTLKVAATGGSSSATLAMDIVKFPLLSVLFFLFQNFYQFHLFVHLAHYSKVALLVYHYV